MLRVRTDHHDAAATTNDATLFTNFPNGGSNFHLSSCLETPAIRLSWR